MNTDEIHRIKDLVLDLNLLVVSLDRLKLASSTDLDKFMMESRMLDLLAKHRDRFSDILECHLSKEEIAEFDAACESLPYWTSRASS